MINKQTRLEKVCEENFFKLAQKALANYPENLHEFLDQWNRKNYRLAYLSFANIKDMLDLSDEEEKLSEDFFWLFVN